MPSIRILSRNTKLLAAVLLVGSVVALNAAVPTVTNVSPGTGLTSGGTVVTITGSGFTGATGVFFGGAPATSFTVDNDTTITATTPARNAGPLDVAVTTTDGTGVLTEGFTYGNVPLTAADTYSTLAGSVLDIAAPGVLSNDTSPISGSVITMLESTTTNGVLVLNGDGSFKYTPTAGFVGTDSFSYRAVNDAGAGRRATVTINVTVATTPQPPVGLFVASVSGNTVTFRWTHNPAGVAPTGHLIEAGSNSGEVLGTVATGSPNPVATITAPTGVLFFRVRAIAGADTSGPSNEVRVFVNMPVVPSAPEGLVGLVNGSVLGLTWLNGYAGGEPASLVLDVTGSIVTSLPLGLVDSFTFAGVPAGTYTLSLRAINSSGSSVSSPPVTLTFPGPCSGVPSPPTKFVAYRVGSAIHVYWNPPTSGPAPTSYVLNVTGALVGTFPTMTRSMSGTVGAGSYGLSVTSVNPCGSSAPTAVQTVVVPLAVQLSP